MRESKVMKELRETRDRISSEIINMDINQMKEYYKKKSVLMLDEVGKIRAKKGAL